MAKRESMGWTMYLVYGNDWGGGWFEFQAFTTLYLIRIRMFGLAFCIFRADLEEVGASWYYWLSGDDPRKHYPGQPRLHTIEEARAIHERNNLPEVQECE